MAKAPWPWEGCVLPPQVGAQTCGWSTQGLKESPPGVVCVPFRCGQPWLEVSPVRTRRAGPGQSGGPSRTLPARGAAQAPGRPRRPLLCSPPPPGAIPSLPRRLGQLPPRPLLGSRSQDASGAVCNHGPEPLPDTCVSCSTGRVSRGKAEAVCSEPPGSGPHPLAGPPRGSRTPGSVHSYCEGGVCIAGPIRRTGSTGEHPV